MSRIEENFLIDLEFGVKEAQNGDIQLITGIENLKQALFNRLVTVKGSLAHRPEYGVGVQLWQGSIGSIDKQRQLAIEIKKQFEKDPRVSKVTSVAIKADESEPSMFIVQYKVEAVGIGELVADVNPFGDFSL